ncbi:MAG TPA: CHRD domain-containing protein [Nitrososphaeraceae archaeon]
MSRIAHVKLVLLVVSMVTLLGTIFISTNAQAAKFTASMSGNQVAPPTESSMNGTASFRTTSYDTVIKYKIKVSGSSDVTSADIHLGESGKNGETVVDLLKDSKKNGIKQGTSIRGNITNTDLKGSLEGRALTDLILAMKNGTAYINIDTPYHENGEIRGQIVDLDSINSTKNN